MLQNTLLGFAGFDLAFYFVIYALLGWLLESGYAWVEQGHFVNRGFLNGPFCPIYGFGSVLLIVILHPWVDNLFLLFGAAVILTSILEYITGLVLEKFFQDKWWDYSNRRFNLQGYICLRFSIYWGIGAVIMLKYLHPEISKMVGQIPYQAGVIFLYGLALYLTVDFIHTLRSVLEIKSLLLEIRLLSMEAREKLEQIKETSLEALEETREDIREDIRVRYEELLARASVGSRRLFKAFPDLKSRNYEKIFQELKERWRQRSNGDQE